MRIKIGDSTNGRAYCKYSPKSDKWFVHNGERQGDEVDRPTALFDLDNMETGWFLFREGRPPERTLDPDLEHRAPKPSDEHRRGFAVKLFSPKNFGGTVEFSSTSMHTLHAMEDLHEEFSITKAEHPGQVPVVRVRVHAR